MENAIYIALSSQMALQRQTDVVANNLANLSTPAFKGEEMLFSQFLVRPEGNGLTNGRDFADLGTGTPDGFRCDIDGNLWCGWGMSEELNGVAIFAPDGTISASQDGTKVSTKIGKLEVVDFANPQAVTPGANGLYVTDQTPQPAAATVQQGMLEESNVQPVVELTRLLGVSRAFAGINNFLALEGKRQLDAIDKLGKVS